MASIVSYARAARDTFADRPLCQVDQLCLACLAYLRYPDWLGVDNRAGIRLADLADERLVPLLTQGLHDPSCTAELVRALGGSPRFGNVRACLHASESSEEQGMQFSATTFVLPDGAGAVAAFRGTDDTVLGWKENLRLAGDDALPAQRRAASYLGQVVEELGCRFWVCGHSKGGALACYACGVADDATRAQIVGCLSFDGPGLSPQLRGGADWHDDVPCEKVVPRGSLVGMLFERSQQGMTVVRSSAEGVYQHDPFTWETDGMGFTCERGMDYEAWRLSQRLNDWLEDMGPADRASFVELLGWMMDATAETSFSALLRRWSSNSEAMRALLESGPAEDRELFERVMGDLVVTVLLGSAREHQRTEAGTRERADQASRQVEDLSARVNDRLSKIDRLTGR